jgi:hypothetical protein
VFRHGEYMLTEHWRQRRIAYYMSHSRKCRGCGSTDAIELHHLSYENVYAEPDEDLMPLCEGCHAFVHIWHRKNGGQLAKATRLALAEMRRPRPVRESKPVGKHEPNAILFAAVRHRQAHPPKSGVSGKQRKKAGRLWSLLQQSDSTRRPARAEHASSSASPPTAQGPPGDER